MQIIVAMQLLGFNQLSFLFVLNVLYKVQPSLNIDKKKKSDKPSFFKQFLFLE